MEAQLKAAATSYLEAWSSNSKDVAAMQATFFCEDMVLRDWDDSFFTFGHAARSASTSTVCCEILIHLNDDKKTVIKAINAIEFAEDLRIKAIRGYKC